MTLRTEQIRTLDQLDAFPEGNEAVDFHHGDRDSAYLGAVRRITEHFLTPVLKALITAFPFTVLGFHADNGSEFINHRVAALLAKLHIDEFTKSRPRRSGDNALIESKNGSIVRKWLGHTHIPRDLAPLVDAFLRDSLSPFLNFHRPCLFAVEAAGPNGRVKRRHPQDRVATPLDRLRSLPGAETFLKPGVTLAELDRLAASSCFDAAKAVTRARGELFRAVARAIESTA